MQSVCNYLSNPNGSVEIWSNAPGCNNPEEVENACGITAIEEKNFNDYLEIYPNPASQEVNISTNDGQEIDEVRIYNLIGQQVMRARLVNTKVDISHLQSGMYIVEVTVENIRIRQKLLVE